MLNVFTEVLWGKIIVTFKLLTTNRTMLHFKFLPSVLRDTCTLPGTVIQSVHVSYDKWGHVPPYPPQLYSCDMYPPYKTLQEII